MDSQRSEKSGGGAGAEAVQKLTFLANNLKTEVDYIKKMFSLQKLQQIDEGHKTLRNLGYEIEVMKLNLDGACTKTELAELEKKFAEFTPLWLFKELQEDHDDLVGKAEFNLISQDIEYLRKDLGRLCTKDEVMTRLNVFSVDVNAKLVDRPTIAYFKKLLSAYDTKIEKFNEALNEQIEKLDITQAD